MSEIDIELDKYVQLIQQMNPTKEIGKVTQVNGFLMRGFVPGAGLGSICEIYPSNREPMFLAEVVGFVDRQILLMPLGEMRGVSLGSRVVLRTTKASFTTTGTRSRSRSATRTSPSPARPTARTTSRARVRRGP